jgi:hypothetical protein
MREGFFQPSIPDHPQHLNPEKSKNFSALLSANPASSIQHPASGIPNPASRIPNPAIRHQILETILLYYQLHLPGFRGVQSHLILRDVLA